MTKKELVDMMKVKNRQEDSEDKSEGVAKNSVDKGTPNEIQQV